jgi:galactose mutarotase-like enzyme
VQEVVGGSGLRMLVDPEHGGRIVSLRHGDHEWLEPSTPAPVGATAFVHGGTGGWDEALPTVAPAGGLADHGDLWNTVWRVVEATPSTLALAASSASADVRLERTIAATDDGLELRYRASTTADVDRPFLWSAHPLIAVTPGTTFDLPGVTALVEEHPARGRTRAVPDPAWAEGTERRGFKAFVPSAALDRVGPHATVAATVAASVAASVVRRDGRRLTLSWDPREIPWLGLYWDTGEFSTRPVIALEPTSAGTDAADRDDDGWTVRAGRPLTWTVAVRADAP